MAYLTSAGSPGFYLHLHFTYSFMFTHFISESCICVYCSYVFLLFICVYIHIYMLRPTASLKKYYLCFIKISHSLDTLGLRTTLGNTLVKTSSSRLYSGGTEVQKDKLD